MDSGELDKDSFSIVRGMIKEWEEAEEKDCIEKKVKPLYRKVMNELSGFYI